MNRRVLILGATSAIARAIATRLSQSGDRVYLSGRDAQELERIAKDLTVRFGHHAHWGVVDASDFSSHPECIRAASRALGGLDGVVFAIGTLGQQPEDSWDATAARRLIDVNLTAGVSLISLTIESLLESDQGFVVGLSSVSGDRGRQSNYAYGAAKGGFSIFLDGLRNRLESTGLRVYTVKLGFVDTAMTFGKEGLFLVASPQQIAAGIEKILSRPSGIYYLPSFWRPIMLAIRAIPEWLFKKLTL